MAQQTHIRLNEGIDIPQIGLGVWIQARAEVPDGAVLLDGTVVMARSDDSRAKSRGGRTTAH